MCAAWPASASGINLLHFACSEYFLVGVKIRLNSQSVRLLSIKEWSCHLDLRQQNQANCICPVSMTFSKELNQMFINATYPCINFPHCSWLSLYWSLSYSQRERNSEPKDNANLLVWAQASYKGEKVTLLSRTLSRFAVNCTSQTKILFPPPPTLLACWCPAFQDSLTRPATI